MDLVHVLKSAVDQGCSDVHILVGKPPMMRKNGEIRPIDRPATRRFRKLPRRFAEPHRLDDRVAERIDVAVE